MSNGPHKPRQKGQISFALIQRGNPTNKKCYKLPPYKTVYPSVWMPQLFQKFSINSKRIPNSTYWIAHINKNKIKYAEDENLQKNDLLLLTSLAIFFLVSIIYLLCYRRLSYFSGPLKNHWCNSLLHEKRPKSPYTLYTRHHPTSRTYRRNKPPSHRIKTL